MSSLSRARSAAFWTFFVPFQHITGKTSLLRQISHTTSCSLAQHQCGKASVASQGEYSESNTRVLCSLPADWRRLPVDVQELLLAMIHSAEPLISKVENTNRPHSLGEEQDSKLGNSLIVIGIFLYQRNEENIMDFCITTI